MRTPRLFWLISLALFLVYVWTWTESATVTIHVADGRCTAELYGRSSTIDCPGLTGGTLIPYIEDPASAGQPDGTLGRLMPGSVWQGVTLTAADDNT